MADDSSDDRSDYSDMEYDENAQESDGYERNEREKMKDTSYDSNDLIYIQLWFHMLFAFTLRVLFMVYGIFHDQMFKVKYTDVDYSVFTDGAYYLSHGRSPFLRDGYRYSPLLAYIVLPNVLLFNTFGKLLFILADLATGLLIYKILQQLKTNSPEIVRITKSGSISAAMVWLYNPLTLVISTRGSSDTIITFLVLVSLLLVLKRQLALAGAVFGLVVHFKQYPVIYALIIYCFLRHQPQSSHSSSQKTVNRSSSFIARLNPFNTDRVLFFAAALITFTLTTYYCYLKFGEVYINEGWLYHFSRIDKQHNFSVYFYLYYLAGDDYIKLIAKLAFVPQVLVMLASALYVLYEDDPARASMKLMWSLFSVTFWFVNLNKVITSQYFVWYFALFPLLVQFLDKQHLTTRRLVGLLIVWLAAQGQWLLPAYLYEFRHLAWAWHWIGCASFVFNLMNWAIYATLRNNFRLELSSTSTNQKQD